MAPESGRNNPAMRLSTVVLPLPDGPTKAVTLPLATKAKFSENPVGYRKRQSNRRTLMSLGRRALQAQASAAL